MGEGMNLFQSTIKKYLDERAKNDELFAVTYAKENKSIEECCNYILKEVQKSKREAFADEEIYGLAVHYYDEDSIKDVKATTNVRIVVPTDNSQVEEKPVQVVEKVAQSHKPKKSKKQIEEEFEQRQLSLF